CLTFDTSRIGILHGCVDFYLFTSVQCLGTYRLKPCALFPIRIIRPLNRLSLKQEAIPKWRVRIPEIGGAGRR
ncbi:hypothetical protein IGI04_022014, partial [Brassica rapa subsp. trilocularis]